MAQTDQQVQLAQALSDITAVWLSKGNKAARLAERSLPHSSRTLDNLQFLRVFVSKYPVGTCCFDDTCATVLLQIACNVVPTQETGFLLFAVKFLAFVQYISSRIVATDNDCDETRSQMEAIFKKVSAAEEGGEPKRARLE